MIGGKRKVKEQHDSSEEEGDTETEAPDTSMPPPKGGKQDFEKGDNK